MRSPLLQIALSVILLDIVAHWKANGLGLANLLAPSTATLVPLPVAAGLPNPFAPSPIFPSSVVVLAPSFAPAPFFPAYPAFAPPPLAPFPGYPAYPPAYGPPHPFPLATTLLNSILAKKGRYLPPPPPSPPYHYPSQHPQHPEEHVVNIHISKEYPQQHDKHHHENHHHEDHHYETHQPWHDNRK